MYRMVRALFKQKKYTRRLAKRAAEREALQKLNHKVTDYFSVRKSDRRTEGEVQEERRRLLEFALRKGVEDGLEVRYIEGKGRGVFTTKHFHKGEFVVEYSGELIDINEAYRRGRNI
ncbi:hypothetical protein NQ317_015498 [Molorchus minor]|uniref:Uncharacterized protein n=1 Tax=Molorchus minor TaxID=1323400 RepID=A0ABQ9JM93_9CUCU|nr:hypothetical protein NQ317_015498 [Molorchus minor]